MNQWNPNNLTFAIKGEGKEEKISFEISDIQISIYYDLIVRKIIPVVISGNWTWTDLMIKGGATIKPCGGQECSSGKSWCCTPPTDDELRKICAGQTGDDSTIGSANPGIALGTYSSIEECMDQIETMKLFFIVNVYLHLVHRLHFRRVLKED